MTAPFDFAPCSRPARRRPPSCGRAFPSTISSAATTTPSTSRSRLWSTAATAVLRREGATLATYGLNSGPLGYRPLREFLAKKLKDHAGIGCSPDEILITSGSMQGLDLVNSLLLAKGDTVLIEQETYGGALTKLNKLGVNVIGIPLDEEGLRLDILEADARRAEEEGRDAQVHLHHPDGAESDRRHHGRDARARR